MTTVFQAVCEAIEERARLDGYQLTTQDQGKLASDVITAVLSAYPNTPPDEITQKVLDDYSAAAMQTRQANVDRAVHQRQTLW